MIEKRGSAFRAPRQMVNFREAIENCGLSEIPTYGSKFTWSNKRRGAHFTKEKWDRVMANREAVATLASSVCNVL